MARKLIERITPDQQAQLAGEIDRWLKIGRSTERLDRPRAAAAITAMYAAIGKPAPAVLFFSSPLMCLLARSALQVLSKNSEAPLRSQLWSQLWSQLESQLESQLRSQLESQLESQLRSQLRSQLWSQLESQLESQLRSQLWSQLWSQLGSQLGSQLWSQLESQLRSQLWSQLESQLGSQLWSQLESQLGSQLWSQLESQLGSQLWSQLESQLGSQLGSQLRLQLGHGDLWNHVVSNVCAGAWWSAWEVFYDFCNKIGVTYPNEARATLDLWQEQSRACHWWFPYDGIVFASERPSVLEVDSQGRLHNPRSAAIEYSDGYGLFALHGVRIEPDYIKKPETLTPEKIEATSNQEERRVLIAHYGAARYIQDSGATLVHELPENYFLKGLAGAKLFSKLRPGDSTLIMVKVKNSTPEPDGSVKDYFLRVDPRAYGGDAARNAHAAVASTFRDAADHKKLAYADWRKYAPMFES